MGRDRLVERVRAVGVRDEVGGLRLGHLDPGAQDNAGQAHAANSGPEQLSGLTGRLQVQHAAVRHQQLHGQHVVAKRARRVVVLTVNIRADRTTDGDLAGTRQHRNPQAIRQGGLHQLVEAHARVDVDNAGIRVDGVDPVQRSHIDDQTATILGGVTIGAAQAAGDDAAALVLGQVRVLIRDPLDCLRDRVHVRGGQDLGGGRGGTAPSVEGLGCQFHAHNPTAGLEIHNATNLRGQFFLARNHRSVVFAKNLIDTCAAFGVHKRQLLGHQAHHEVGQGDVDTLCCLVDRVRVITFVMLPHGTRA